MKKWICIGMAILTVLALCACQGKKTEPFEKVRHAEITVKDYGVIKLELDEGSAPITVANFIKLAQEGFYDGLTFHRIMDGFIIQGGDPEGNGTGGSE
ncbi:MAG: peptidylprolyl isomerase, partial [Oscillospiraceae bacterium]|nr:peptidylprolyl isomerase [Oscillospiraceae bacterium]